MNVKKSFGLATFLLAAFAFITMGVFVTAGLDLTGSASAAPFWSEPAASQKAESPLPGNFTKLAKRLSPTVVNISTTQKVKRRTSKPMPQFNGPFQDFFKDFNQFFDEGPREFKRQMLGSGFILNKDGYILTNFHVIENASEIIVSLSDHKKDYKGRVIGRDKNLDIALIKIDPKQELIATVLGDSDTLDIGAWVVAIGNPFGLGGTVTAGIVSQKGRILGSGPYDNYIQTDASINPGNSGGPLFNIRGEVVGINTAIIAGGQGIGFAVPINMVKAVLKQLKEKGAVTRGWIGVSVQVLTPELAKSFGLKEPKGALVSAVTPGDPADKAGVKPGDIIVSFNGEDVKTLNDLPRIVAATTPGKTTKMKVLREGGEKTLFVKVGKKRDVTDMEKSPPVKDGSDARFGINVEPLTPELARRMGASRGSGVYISRVAPDSPAYDAGLKAGDIILEINRSPIKDIKSYNEVINKKTKAGNVLFLIERRHSTIYVVVKGKR
ncbi:MAG: DegQ family serine endoprotease [Thermodesulfobacteriota bacterium]